MRIRYIMVFDPWEMHHMLREPQTRLRNSGLYGTAQGPHGVSPTLIPGAAVRSDLSLPAAAKGDHKFHYTLHTLALAWLETPSNLQQRLSCGSRRDTGSIRTEQTHSRDQPEFIVSKARKFPLPLNPYKVEQGFETLWLADIEASFVAHRGWPSGRLSIPT
jgi:hypothetical protein